MQGSYANHTNISNNSDVDIVVELQSVFGRDITQLSDEEKVKYEQSFSDALITFKEYKEALLLALVKTFKNIEPHAKCLRIPESYGKVNADVVPCFSFRFYKRFLSLSDQDFVPGIKFYDTDENTQIINYPKLHLKNCESKNIDTDGVFKKVVRIFKNIKRELEETGDLQKGLAPSYFIENLIYNCSSPCFDGDLFNSTIVTMQFLFDAVKSNRIGGFQCANEQDSLFTNNWDLNDAITYLNKAGEYIER